MPDIVFIDGGLGQLNQAIMVMNSIGIRSMFYWLVLQRVREESQALKHSLQLRGKKLKR